MLYFLYVFPIYKTFYSVYPKLETLVSNFSNDNLKIKIKDG